MFLKKSDFVANVAERYKSKPYLATTQNLSYIQKLCSAPEKAFTILGSGDSVFQLIYNGAKDITAVDINENQLKVFSLRRAAIKALDRSDFYEFLLHASGAKFLSRDIFEQVLPFFEPNELGAISFWQNFLETFDASNVFAYGLFFKGGIEFCGINSVRNSLSYMGSSDAYCQLRENLKTAKVRLYRGDAINFLTRNGMGYDYIDLSNILVYCYQYSGFESTVFGDSLKRLGDAWDRSVYGKASTMVLDYFFGIRGLELKNGLIKTRKAKTVFEGGLIELYDRIFSLLNAGFNDGIEIMEVKELVDAMPTKGFKDSILYVVK